MHRRKMECVIFPLWVTGVISAHGTFAKSCSTTWMLFLSDLCHVIRILNVHGIFHFHWHHCCSLSICNRFPECDADVFMTCALMLIHTISVPAVKHISPFPLYYCQNSNCRQWNHTVCCTNINFQKSSCKPSLHPSSKYTQRKTQM